MVCDVEPEPQHVGPYDPHPRAERFAQYGDPAGVQLDGGDGMPAGGEPPGERAVTCAELQDGDGWIGRDQPGDAIGDAAVGKEVLAEFVTAAGEAAMSRGGHGKPALRVDRKEIRIGRRALPRPRRRVGSAARRPGDAAQPGEEGPTHGKHATPPRDRFTSPVSSFNDWSGSH